MRNWCNQKGTVPEFKIEEFLKIKDITDFLNQKQDGSWSWETQENRLKYKKR